MSRLQPDGPADDLQELKQLLDYNGIRCVWENGNCRFLLSSCGVKWETVCCPTGDGAVIIYGYYPFSVGNRQEAGEFCQKVNAQVRYGSMFLADQRLVFRIGADLFDPYSAYETLGRALEYCAGVMVRFWVQAERTVHSSFPGS